MKRTQDLFLTGLILATLTTGAWAQTDSASKGANPKTVADAASTATVPAITPADFQAMKDAISAQQQQIKALQDELRHRDQAVQQAQSAAADAVAKADAVQVQAARAQQSVSTLESDVAELKTVSTSAANSVLLKNAVLTQQDSPSSTNQESEQVYNKQMESPITIRFRGINITPGGYAAAEFIRRSRALSADVATPFNSLTMPGASQSRVSEFFGSGRQSKTTVFVDGRLGNVDLSSYVSADFLSAGVTSTSTSTNGYTLRLRQAWAQAKFQSGWSFVGGQMFSMVTENGKGIAPDDDMGKTNDVRPKTVDSSYNVGFTYARQYGIRLTKSFGDKFAVAIAVENPQATVTTHGNASNFLVGQSGASNSYNSTATYSFNPAPDLIAKVAFDPGFGHYEIFGLTDRFTGRVFPCVENFASAACGSLKAASAVHAYNFSQQGAGAGASARWTFAKRLTFGLKGFGGSGIGRYGPGGLADATIKADGTIHLIKGYQGLGTLELKFKKLDLYSYGGVEYAKRSWNIDTTVPTKPVFVGYGAPGFSNTGCYSEAVPGSGGFAPGSLAGCTGDTRALIEGTFGFWYRFYSGPKGSFRYGTQYSYLTRNTWSGAGGLPAGSAGRQPNGLDSMVFSSFRYYLP